MDKNEKSLIDDITEAVEKEELKVTFGIQPEQIKFIEEEVLRFDKRLDQTTSLKPGWILYDYHFWERMGRKFGCSSLTLALYYFEYKHKKEKLCQTLKY